MNTNETPGRTPSLPEGRLQGRQAFTDLVRQALTSASHDGWPHLILSDPDFLDWPLGERAVVSLLDEWARSGRRIQFLATDFSRMRELHPRLVRWRVTWSHIVEAHACRASPGGVVPSAIWSPVWCMERLDVERCVMVASSSADRRAALQERLQGCWHQGSPSFPASILGL